MKNILITLGILIVMLIPARASEAGIVDTKVADSFEYAITSHPPHPLEIKVVQSLAEAQEVKKASFVVRSDIREPLPRIDANREDIINQAHTQVAQVWSGDDQWQAFKSVAMRESGFNPNALNKSSGACGIPQALPCSKIKDKSISGQIDWMINYIKSRYGTPQEAWAHSQNKGWY